MRPKAFILSVKQCFLVLYINPANHAPGVKNGSTLEVISSHILTMGKTHKKIFTQKLQVLELLNIVCSNVK